MLSERGSVVLMAIVRSYIERPDPVGSRYVTKKYAFNLSPATIRNIMADLEEMGYLSQPHTSAGRVPTDKGYRFYVDSLRSEGAPAEQEVVRLLKRKFEAMNADVNVLLREVTDALSGFSRYLVFAVPLKPEKTTLNRIQLFKYRGRQTVAVLLTNEGLIQNRVLDGDFGLSQRELNRVSEYLNSEFSGHTIQEIRSEIMRQVSKEKALYDILVSKAVTICGEALSFQGGDIIFSGLSELLGLPDFADRINEIAKAIDDKQVILKLLDRIAETSEEVQVVIGSENPVERFRGLSIVTATYSQGERFLGSVGMIGPTRMDYPRAISMVGMTARFITEAISK
jgi:heat-inducible transcriptional repressor